MCPKLSHLVTLPQPLLRHFHRHTHSVLEILFSRYHPPPVGLGKVPTSSL